MAHRRNKTKQDDAMRACQLRYEGVRAEEAAKKLRVSVHTYNNWFRSGGKLHDQYAQFCKEMDGEYKTTARRTIMRAVGVAAHALVEEVTNSDDARVRIMAAREILLRGLGKPNEEGSGDIVVVMTEPVRKEYVPAGYNKDGSPITTVNDAVELNERLVQHSKHNNT